MRELDDTDLAILQLLVEDARRPYSEIADRVGVSPPTVSDRVDRLEEIGVIERFTLDLDRTKLDEGIEVLLDVDVRPGEAEEVANQLDSLETVEHVFTSVDDSVIAQATVPENRVRAMLGDAVDMDLIDEYDVRLLSSVNWTPQVSGTEFAIACEECGNTVADQGESVSIDGTVHHFCSSSCRTSFEEEYERLATESV
jgi:DNA-binding Lrp family transcriptional regulator